MLRVTVLYRIVSYGVARSLEVGLLGPWNASRGVEGRG